MVKIVHLPDIHFGNPGISTEWLRYELQKYVYPQMADCQLVTIGGDFFDTLLDLNSPAGQAALLTIDELIHLSIEHGFYLRVLDGTFVHDRKMTRCFLTNTLSKTLLHGLPRVRVMDAVTLEYLEPIKLRMGYIPDDTPHEDNLAVLKDLLHQAQWDQVDVLVNHGYFAHMLGKLPVTPRHTLDYTAVKPLVKGVVLNGHVHTPGVYHNVISGGSLERDRHGEEEAKGFFTVELDPATGKHTYHFHENPEATVFKTIDLTDALMVEDATDRFLKWVEPIMTTLANPQKLVHLRILANDPMIRSSLDQYTKTRYSNVVVTTTRVKPVTQESDAIVLDMEELPEVTPTNLVERIITHLALTKSVTLTAEEVNEVLQL